MTIKILLSLPFAPFFKFILFCKVGYSNAETNVSIGL